MRITLAKFKIYPRPKHTQFFGMAVGITRRLTSIFSCRHREMSRPFSSQGETYRVCLRCGARRQFDPRNWETRGDYYHVAGH